MIQTPLDQLTTGFFHDHEGGVYFLILRKQIKDSILINVHYRVTPDSSFLHGISIAKDFFEQMPDESITYACKMAKKAAEGV